MCAAATVVIYVLSVYLKVIIIIYFAWLSATHLRKNNEMLFD
jgi:hypothetical protein